MRFDIRTLAQLREAVRMCDCDDRLVLYFPKGVPPCRFRVFEDNDEFHWEYCDLNPNMRDSK